MSLIGALNTAGSALAAQQAAIQTTGNNIANAGDANYSREVTNISPGQDQQISQGLFLGTGVDLTSVQRQVNDALNTRLNAAVSDNQSATTSSSWLGQIQTTFNELGSSDLSTSMSTFFGAWSNLANNPQDVGLRQVVVQDGEALATSYQGLRSQLSGLQSDVGQALQTQVSSADTLASQIADLNGEIGVAEGGGSGQANALRDQRDGLLKQLSGLMNIQTVQQANGVVDVYVGSDPLVADNQSQGVALKQTVVNGQTTNAVVFKATGGTMQFTSGSLKGLSDAQTQVTNTITQTDSLAHNLIFQLNKLHSSGQGLDGFSTVTATNAVTDPTVALNDPKSGLTFKPTNGSFVVHVTDTTTGQVTSTLVQVPLTGSASDATLNSLTSSLAAINGVSASVNGGKLTIAAANSGETISFSQDSSGVLAALGVNSFFTGTDSSDITVNAQVASDPSLIAASNNGEAGDNSNATAIASLETAPVAGLQGVTLTGAYDAMVNGISTQTATAKNNATAAQAVQDTLQSQRDSLSGVSVDEEAINLLQQQRAYQGAARVISTVDQLMQTLLAMPIELQKSPMSIFPTSLARVSNLQQSNVAQSQIASTESALQQVQNEISTGHRINVPSDDPGDAAMVMELQKSLEKSTTYTTNLQSAQSQLSETDSTLGDLTTLVQQAQSIASADVGSDTTAAARVADGDIVQSIYTQSLSIANKQFNGVYLFGGDKATSSPFVDNNGGIEFTGSDTVLQNAVDTNASLSLQVSASSVFGSFSSRVQGTADLTPSISTSTRLIDLGGAGGSGVQLGSIQIQNGTASQTVDLSGADNLGDVINDINNAHIGGVTASLNAAHTGITLSGTPTENIKVLEVGGGNTAQSLGILNVNGNGAGSPDVGGTLQPKVTALTTLASLKGGAGIDTTSGITITNGTKSATVSFAGATTVEDMLNDINGSGTGVKAQINAAGNGIDILNATQGLTLTIGENGGTTAADLGVRSYGPSTDLSELNNGKGVGTVAGADFQVTSTTGSTFSVDLDSSDKTVQDVINAINSAATTAGVGVTASFATTGNGINLSDTSGGTGQLGVTALNFSTAAADLGLTAKPASQTQINGADVNGVQTTGVFSDLAKLRDALQNNDQAGITAAATQLQDDYNRIVNTRGSNGATVKEAQSRQDQISTETLATQSLLSSLQDADITKTVTQFQTLQTSLQATLQTQARTLNISLLDFLS